MHPPERPDTSPRPTKHTESANVPRDNTVRKIYIGIVLFLACWMGSTFTWGLPGFYLPVVLMVPILVLLLVRIARG